MTIRREFLTWNSPALAAAAEAMRERFARAGQWDLSGVILVVPAGRAARRLLEIFVATAEQQKLVLLPPAIVTPESFPEMLYQARWPLADVLTQQLAWCQALRTAPRELVSELLPFPPEPEDTPRWLAVGDTLRRLHLELAADGLNCEKVLQGAAVIDGFTEADRWRALCDLQRRYLNVLDELELWDVQTARLVAIEKREIHTDKQVVLVGTVDLNRTQRQMLDQIAERVTTIVFAPAEYADRFDQYGCVVPSTWTQAELPLADAQIERVDGPADQAEGVACWLESLAARFRADQIAIGLPDERLAPHIERQLAQCGLASHWAIGKKLAETAPFRLIKVAADYAARGRYRDLAALVRHPDVHEWLTGELRVWKSKQPKMEKVEGQNVSRKLRTMATELITALDDFASERLPSALDAERLQNEPDEAYVLAIEASARGLVKPLTGKRRPLDQWADPLRSILIGVYGERPLDRENEHDRYLTASLQQIAEALTDLSLVPRQLQPAVDARQACRIVLQRLAGEGIPPLVDPDSIEMLGWLDLPLDDAPATIVTTFNEGWIPSSSTADAYLPNRLREALGLMHNDRRLARDAYSLSLLLASRKELKLIVARRDSEGNPLAPSRLLFATDREQAVARACRFFGELPAPRPRRGLIVPPEGPPPRPGLLRPLPERLSAPITALSVTKFRDYLSCKYRFYLRHVLGLKPLADDADELDGGAFGGLAHLVLEQFGRADESKELRYDGESGRIAEYLQDKLTQFALARFGKQYARPAVLVQVEQIRLRLGAFAQWQALRNRDGWRIVFSEDSNETRSLAIDWPVDGQPFTLQGRIDRIDFHEGRGRLCVVDYKTADRGDPPERTHRQSEEWVDLQLPLYRHLVRAVKLPPGVPADAPIELGYIVLPLDLRGVGLLLADWDEAMLRSADEKAREVVRGLRTEAFWPPTSPPPNFFDDVAAICQDRRLGSTQDEAA
jgi:ATP-dependent helicase/nuclease subunit B